MGGIRTVNERKSNEWLEMVMTILSQLIAEFYSKEKDS